MGEFLEHKTSIVECPVLLKHTRNIGRCFVYNPNSPSGVIVIFIAMLMLMMMMIKIIVVAITAHTVIQQHLVFSFFRSFVPFEITVGNWCRCFDVFFLWWYSTIMYLILDCCLFIWRWWLFWWQWWQLSSINRFHQSINQSISNKQRRYFLLTTTTTTAMTNKLTTIIVGCIFFLRLDQALKWQQSHQSLLC